MTRIKHNLSLELNDFVVNTLLKNVGNPSSPSFNEEMTDYIRELFADLNGQIDLISIGKKSIQVVWSRQSDEEPNLASIVKILNKGKYLEAGLVFELLLSDDPDYINCLYNLGMIYSDLGILDRSIAYLRTLTEKDPKNSNGWVALGVALLRNNDDKVGIEALKRAVESDPNNPWGHRNLGASLLKLGDAEAGINHLRKAIKLNPKDELAWYGLAQGLEEQKADAEADGAYKKAIDIDEFSQVAELARQGRSRIAQNSFRAVTPKTERMDAVMYCLSALEKFQAMSEEDVRKIGYEIALLGTKGLDVNDPSPKYKLNSLAGQFSGLHLVSLEYAAFKVFAPGMDIGFDLSKEYQAAMTIFKK